LLDDIAKEEFLALPNQVPIEVIGVEVDLLQLCLMLFHKLIVDAFLSLNLLMLILALPLIEPAAGILIGNGRFDNNARAFFTLRFFTFLILCKVDVL
jgi:hypothetical protein